MPEWRRLLEKYPIASWLALIHGSMNAGNHGSIMAGYRGWLAQLPREARQIAFRNGERLFRK